jgi:hypothetical protein
LKQIKRQFFNRAERVTRSDPTGASWKTLQTVVLRGLYLDGTLSTFDEFRASKFRVDWIELGFAHPVKEGEFKYRLKTEVSCAEFFLRISKLTKVGFF